MAKPKIGENGLRIVSLVAENIKKLVAVEINPSGSMVTISGKNGAGKSSIIDAIMWAVGGTSGIQSQPIRKGQTKARIKLNLGEITVERRFNEKGSTLIVESADGARFPSPQRMLDELIGALSFDPHAFMRMDAKKQANELRRVAQIDVDIDALDGLNARDFERRTGINRDARAKRVQAEAITVASDLPDAPLDEAALLDQMQLASDHNASIETRRNNRDNATQKVADRRAHAQRTKDEAAALRRQADELDQAAEQELIEAAELEKKIADAGPLPTPMDVAAIRVQLEHAKQVNAKLAARDRRAVIESEATALEQQAQELTDQIDARRQAKADAIAAATMPVPGLGFENGIVTYNGIPFDQASAGEQLKVSFGIARAANPKLRVISIKDASLLDESSLAQIAEMAKDGDYQCWIERVDTSGKLGIYIEDGAVAAIDGQPVEQEAAA